MAKTITIRVERFDPKKDKKPYLQSFTIPFTPTMRVLDAIQYIQDHIDGTIAFRYNCQMGICGSCAMEVNGQPVLTCKTELKHNLLGVTIKVLKAFPPVKDLVADYDPVYEREKHMKLHFEPEKTPNTFLKMKEEDVKDAQVFKSCIECMICMDSCRPMRDGNHNFLGPKTIVKAKAYDFHPHDKLDRTKILEKEGIWHCNITRCCQNHCPQNIPITDRGILPSLGKSRNKK
ncbi:MAG: succinate dehydrogenase/fumarate reductase iron-sulfur subunit [Candidatus Nanoarchaeia archaeon]